MYKRYQNTGKHKKKQVLYQSTLDYNNIIHGWKNVVREQVELYFSFSIYTAVEDDAG